jgi:hypothetical protein
MRCLDCFRPLAGLLVLLIAHVALAAPASAQERSGRDYNELIEKLELGISALDDLGRGDAREQLQRIADELREERDRATAARRKGSGERENGEIREVRRRLAVMRYAVDVLVETKRIDAAELVERAMHTRELAIAGERGAEAQRIREAAPNRAQLAEVLQYASRLHAERGQTERAKALSDLSKVYLGQWKRRQRAEGGRVEREGEREPERDLSDLGARLEILRLARNAHAEVRSERLVGLLESAIHIGELQLEGADAAKLRAAIQGAEPEFSMGMVIECLQAGSRLYREWRMPRRAASLTALAEYYAKRERARRADGEASVAADREHEAAAAEIRQLMEKLERLEAALKEVRAELRALDRRAR